MTNVIYAGNDSLGRNRTTFQATVKNLVTTKGEGITAEKETLVWGTTGFRNLKEAIWHFLALTSSSYLVVVRRLPQLCCVQEAERTKEGQNWRVQPRRYPGRRKIPWIKPTGQPHGHAGQNSFGGEGNSNSKGRNRSAAISRLSIQAAVWRREESRDQ
ncbi:hypothetical protein BO79DRAFT_220170 [Aspergillus costaricaensis CBS 115574]|uniref:Uncharacterized protein n=1 Tax=Aspergillus costaricaensis CBS 115574 TaxID=1448317 RepID=A0ACD1I838_9EURO|nr:hypothetical protein BO79DRAFT_220170 [Aspergillus costaricaensis CBS 115574]RAK86163.1 hypothetical protein BO79DRAFT_220170 [Aspergillus costaricaensis CBS 115574]